MKNNLELEAVQLSDYFDDCEWLYCYTFDVVLASDSESDGRYIVGLPKPIVPFREALEYFAKILLLAPELFGATAHPPHRILAAACQLTHDDTFVWTYTGNLQFQQFPMLIADRTRPRLEPKTRFYSLTDSKEALQRLSECILQEDPQIGYELQLQFVHYKVAQNEHEHERIEEQLHLLRQRRAELEILRRCPRPVLMRFRQEQLPSLADVLRSCWPDDLSKVEYAFAPVRGEHPHKDYPEGLHFLLFPEPLPLVKLEPMLGWEDHQTKHFRRRFWLDPHWAKAYFSGENRVQLFVPYGMRLWPSVYSWTEDEIDDYLHGIFSRWLHGQYTTQSLPEHALCIFDGHPAREDLTLTVLDRQAFISITDKSCVSWINTNLHILQRIDQMKSDKSDDRTQRYETFRDILIQLDRAYTQDRLFETLLTDNDEREEAFMREADQLLAKALESIGSIADIITEEFNNLLDGAEKLFRSANALNGQIGQLTTGYQALEADFQRLQAAGQRTLAAREDLGRFTTKLGGEVVDQIIDADNAQKKLRDDVTTMTERLEQTHRQLLRQLQQTHQRIQRLKDEIGQ